MQSRVLAILAGFVLLLSACTSTEQYSGIDFAPPQGDYSLVVMRPDVSVGLLTAGGGVEPRKDWTDQARGNLIDALKHQQAGRGGRTHVAESFADTGADPELVRDLTELHDIVGLSIQLHKYSGVELPTKRGRFDWTLGDKAVRFGEKTGYDYALFLHAEDSFSSSGRTALRILGLAGCVIGACALVPGKTRLAFASLVDLKSGDIVWYNVLVSSVGDMRTPEGARATIDKLLGDMRPGKRIRASARAAERELD